MIVPFLARPSVRLFLTSAALLCAELLLIRWVPGKIIYVGFFNNFVLMSSFLGIGLGVLSGRSAWKPRVDPAPLLLFLLTAVVLSGRLNVALPSSDQIFIGEVPLDLIDVNVLVLASVVVLTTFAMASLARPLGPLFREIPPLRAYATDIGGALFGITLFAALSALETQPVVWFGALSILLGLLGLGAGMGRTSARVGATALACILGLAIFDQSQGLDQWSSYHRLSLYRTAEGNEELSVNGIPYQTMVAAESAPAYFSEVYRTFAGRTFSNVLVIGAGTGNDTAAALRHGVVSVDAVDIDPAIFAVGVKRHPDRPYDDPRVHRYVDDGRAFLSRSTGFYDLIVFAQTDSFVLVGNSANVRLESFLFTEEAFAAAKEHLAPDGVVVLYNAYRERWLVDRYATTLRDVFAVQPIVRTYPEFRTGYRAWLAVSAAAPVVASTEATGSLAPARDDWPFPYLHDRAIAPRYLIALGLMVAFAIGAVALTTAKTGASLGRFSPHFFLLGAAFLLLETRSLVIFSLLFGTTWYVNALAFFAILVIVLAAIGVNARFRIRRAWTIYVAIFGSLALNALTPPTVLLIDPPWLRYSLAGTLVFAPIFFANVAFSHSFRDSAAADSAFASNLVGAMVGGVLEWSALISGYESLLVLAGILYLAAFLLATRWRSLGDRPVVPGPAT